MTSPLLPPNTTGGNAAKLVSTTLGGAVIVYPELFCTACGEQLSGPNFPSSAWATTTDDKPVCFGCIAAATLKVLKVGEAL